MSFTAIYPIMCGIGIVFIFLPLPWHWRVRNTGTLLYIFWAAVAIGPSFTNSIIWRDNSRNSAPIWCDLSTKLVVGANVGLGAATLCITRQLESIAAARQIHYSHEDRRRRTLIDLGIGIVLPLLVMILHVVVQGHRYDIIEKVGCTPAVYWSIAAIMLVTIWPVILFSASAVYAVLAFRLFVARRYQFAKILQSSKSAMTTSRFVRLIALAIVQVVYNLPIVVSSLAFDLKTIPLNPYPSWSFVHEGFSYVGTISAEEFDLLSPTPRRFVELSFWSYPASCAFFFAFFGLGEEALATYRSWWSIVKRAFRLPNSTILTREKSGSNTGVTRISLPSLVQRSFVDSNETYSEDKKLADRQLPKHVKVDVTEDNYISV